MSPEQIGLWAGFILTLMVFSYLLGDNFLYRLAVYVFVGLAAAFVTVITVESVLLPWFQTTLAAPNADLGVRVLGAIPLVLGLLLLLKGTRAFAGLGNLALAYIIGIGTAVAVVGALAGTLLPLTTATSSGIRTDILNGFLVVIGVISSLVYFQFSARRVPGGGVQRGLPVRVIGAVGQGFIVVTLGALYAGAILTSLTIFSERIAFLFSRFGGG